MLALVDLVLPTECAACGRRGPVICPGCAAALGAPARLVWPRPAPAGLPPPYAVAPYAGTVRDVVVAFKERGAAGLERVLADALARSVAAAAASVGDPDDVLLVAVPSSSAARAARGRDVALDLTRRAAAIRRRSGCTVRVLPALRLARTVQDSAALGSQARADNLRAAFALRRGAASRLAGRTVIVVDDVVTTGVTLRECAVVLQAAGARVAAAATVAATQRRHPPPTL
jgi:predicted amidophosphoribosyltransferase